MRPLLDIRLPYLISAPRCRAAIDESNLFSDLLLVDPVIYPPSVYDAIVGKEAPLSSVVGRQAEFPSRFVDVSLQNVELTCN